MTVQRLRSARRKKVEAGYVNSLTTVTDSDKERCKCRETITGED